MGDVIVNVNNCCDGFTEWDMLSESFPSNSEKGQKFYGVNGPTLTLLDRRGNTIPDSVWLTSLIKNASTTNPLDWSIQYTIV